MSRVVLSILCVCLLAFGCGKRESASPPGSATPPNPGAGAPSPPASVVVADTGDENAMLTQLSAELRKYVVRTRSAPASFEEFVAKANVQAPPPPAGKKYVISKGAVLLVKK